MTDVFNDRECKSALYIYWDAMGNYACECCKTVITSVPGVDSLEKSKESKKVARPLIESHIITKEHIKNHNIYLEIHEKEEDKELYKL